VARQQAVADAVSRARQLSRAAGKRLGRIVSIEEGPRFRRGDSSMTFAAARVSSTPMPLEPGTATCSVSVNVTFKVRAAVWP
jgi:uncharacterized protein YggE